MHDNENSDFQNFHHESNFRRLIFPGPNAEVQNGDDAAQQHEPK